MSPIQIGFFISLLLITTACSPLSVLGSLITPDSGVNANAQLGQENTQAVAAVSSDSSSTTKIDAGDSAYIHNESRETDTANTVTNGNQVVNEGVPMWIFMVSIMTNFIFWTLDSPGRLWRSWRKRTNPYF